MEVRLFPFSTSEYAELYTSFGNKVKRVGSIYWTQPWPFFYRPLLLYEPLKPGAFEPPCRLLGAYQHVVPNHFSANSKISFLVFEQSETYSIAALKSGLRRFVRVAERYFEVRLIESERELKDQGYCIYMSFYARTKYDYMSKRTRKKFFDAWIEAVRANPKTLLLGGYEKGELKAVTICYWVSDLLLYSTFFAETESLKHHISDLMLHTARKLAAEQKGIKRILAGRYGGGIGMDTFYLRRGAEIENKPARYVIIPSLAGSFLQTILPAKFRRWLFSGSRVVSRDGAATVCWERTLP